MNEDIELLKEFLAHTVPITWNPYIHYSDTKVLLDKLAKFVGIIIRSIVDLLNRGINWQIMLFDGEPLASNNVGYVTGYREIIVNGPSLEYCISTVVVKYIKGEWNSPPTERF